MQHFVLTATLVVCLAWTSGATFAGPFIFWGHERVVGLQPRALVEATEADFATLYKDAKAVVIFVRNSTSRFDGAQLPLFQQLVKENAWSYLPQHSLAAEPFNYNTNVEVINLNSGEKDEDAQLVEGFKEAVAIYGAGEVLGILANHEDDSHFIMKRDTGRVEKTEKSEKAEKSEKTEKDEKSEKTEKDEKSEKTENSEKTLKGENSEKILKGENSEKVEEKETEETSSTAAAAAAAAEETDESFVYVADGRKALLYVSSAPLLNLSSPSQSLKLVKHQKAITFDDQRQKGYGRLTIIFAVENDKLFLRFNFTLVRGNWALRAVELEYKEYKTVLIAAGNDYEIPSAPLGFSYHCGATPILFTNNNDTLVLNDYQVQPWMNGTKQFGEAYDCVGFISAPIWAGIMISLFLCGILSIGLLAIMDIKAPNRFESARNKQLTFTVQE